MDCSSNNKNSSNQSSAPPPPHVVMFPFMAQGHIIPFLSLAKLLVHRHRTLTVTFLNTPHTVEKLISSDSGACSGRLRFVALPFDAAAHGLPAGADNTDSLPHPLIPALMHASSALSPHFDALLPSLSPPCTAVIADVFLSWTLAVARRHRVPHAVFTTCGAYGTAAYFSLWLHLPHRSADGQGEFHVPGFPDTFRLKTDQLSFYMRKADGTDGWSTFLRPNILESMRSQSMICNTVAELEPAGLRILQEMTGMRVIRCVGPLLPLDAAAASYGGRSGRAAGVGAEECGEWLQRHPPASVLYVSFGSQNAIAVPQMRALAAGIEAAGVPFVWVVRPPFGSADVNLNDEIREEWLPDGFAARMAENRRGLLVKQWAPQLEILSHPSTGAFLSHCGWNSTLESLSRGVPIIGWPLASEQFYNSKMLEEELGVCVELTRGVESAVESAEVERVIRAVIGGEKGKEMKRRAETCTEIIRAAMREGEGGAREKRKGSSLRAIDEFIEDVVSKSQMQGNGECSETEK